MSGPFEVIDGGREDDVRRLIHRKLDGERLTGDERARLERLLESDAEAHALHDDLAALQGGLRGLPAEPFPEAALEEVLRRTSGRRRRRRRAAAGWAVAAALLLAVGLPALHDVVFPEPSYSAEQVAEAERQLEQVLGFTSQTIDRSARQASEQLFRDDLSPALRRVPVFGDGGGS